MTTDDRPTSRRRPGRRPPEDGTGARGWWTHRVHRGAQAVGDAGHRTHRHLEALFGGPERTRVILLLGAVLALSSADAATVGAAATQLRHALKIDNTDLGLLVTVSSVVAALASMPFGVMADRVKRTRVMAVTVLLWGVTMILSAMTTSFDQLLVARLLLGIVTASAGPVVASLVGDYFPSGERGTIYSYILTGELAGAGIGFAVTGDLAALSWRLAFVVLALPTFYLAVRLYRLPEPARGGLAPLMPLHPVSGAGGPDGFVPAAGGGPAGGPDAPGPGGPGPGSPRPGFGPAGPDGAGNDDEGRPDWRRYRSRTGAEDDQETAAATRAWQSNPFPWSDDPTSYLGRSGSGEQQPDPPGGSGTRELPIGREPQGWDRELLPPPFYDDQADDSAGDLPGPPAGATATGGDETDAQRVARERGVEADPDLVLRRNPNTMGVFAATRYLLRIKSNLILIIASACCYFYLTGLETFAVEFTHEQYSLPDALANILMLIVGAGAIVGVLVGGGLSDRLLHRHFLNSRVTVAGVAALFTTLLFVPAIMTRSSVTALPYLTLAAFALMAQNAPIDAARLDIVPPLLWGRAEGIRTLLRTGAQALAPVLFGLTADLLGGGRSGLQWTFLIMLVPLLANGVILLFALRTYPRDVATAAAAMPPVQ